MFNNRREANIEIIDLMSNNNYFCNDDTSDWVKKAPAKKSRQSKFDKQMSMKKKKLLKEAKYFGQHNEIVNTHIPYGFQADKSPHIILKQWHHRIIKKTKQYCVVIGRSGEKLGKIGRYFIRSRIWETM